MLNVLLPLALLGNGLAAGDMFCTALGLAPLMLALPYGGYVRMVQFLWPRYDPAVPAINAVTLLLDLVMVAVTGQAAARALFAAAAVLIAAVIAISVVKAVPINRYVMALDPESCPADWQERDPRLRWRNWNLVRTVLMVAALAANVAGAGCLI
ncbi:anthrone oxygenase family protein [Sphaerisporangium dianthi]|uniref:Anthrone oxygenase family protein n=1 Tax=Sphaerisporangium dianthi TaxID=1436120 RepID=A0ABV9CJ41_9ACTN